MSSLSDTLLEWYALHGRDLPWRRTRDPYRIWLSEVILQQTRVAQGTDYYLRFTERFPDVASLAAASEEEVLRGYALGCDDYVTKPFSLAVLLARTRALIRRSRGGDGAGLLTCGAVTLDGNRRTCTVNGREARLSPREYDLLECLLRNKGQALSRAQLLDKVWGLDFQGDDRAVDVRVRSLRSALGEAGSQIKTVFKAGYRMEGG